MSHLAKIRIAVCLKDGTIIVFNNYGTVYINENLLIEVLNSIPAVVCDARMFNRGAKAWFTKKKVWKISIAVDKDT